MITGVNVFSVSSVLATASRTLWAFSRENGLPFSHLLVKVKHTTFPGSYELQLIKSIGRSQNPTTNQRNHRNAYNQRTASINKRRLIHRIRSILFCCFGRVPVIFLASGQCDVGKKIKNTSVRDAMGSFPTQEARCTHYCCGYNLHCHRTVFLVLACFLDGGRGKHELELFDFWRGRHL